MKNIKTVLTSSLIVLLAACASNVRTYNPSHNDLSNYETFAYLPNSNVELEGVNYNEEMVNKAIVESVKLNLQKQGMKIERKQPDLLVLISTSTNVEIGRSSEPVYATYPYSYGVTTVSPWYDPYYYYGYNTYSPVIGYNTSTYSYKEGTLVIDLIDQETKKTVWKGVANKTIYSQKTTEAIQKMVDDIFEEFPANKLDT